MRKQIASAFAHRIRPTIVTTVAVASTLRDDALHFDGMNWTEVSEDDWANYSDAFYGFSPEAFLYFLPSLLVLTLDQRGLAADALVSSLDTSGNPDLWTDWFSERFGRLISSEISALTAWSREYLANGENGEGSVFARVQDTLTMLTLIVES